MVTTDSGTTVYNFRVQEDHTYFVGQPTWGFAVWVHNTHISVPAKRLTQAQESSIRKIGNIEKGHLKPHDFSGTLKDMAGNPVPKPGGGYYDHMQEMNNSLLGLRNHAQRLDGVTDAAAVAGRQRALELIKKIEDSSAGFGI